jgi:hypothetical protein
MVWTILTMLSLPVSFGMSQTAWKPRYEQLQYWRTIAIQKEIEKQEMDKQLQETQGRRDQLRRRAQQLIDLLKPKNVVTGEIKNQFSREESVQANGLDFAILNVTYLGTITKPVTTDTVYKLEDICVLELKVKNNLDFTQQLDTSSFRIKSGDTYLAKVVGSYNQSLDLQFPLNSDTLQSGQEVIRQMGFWCPRDEEVSLERNLSSELAQYILTQKLPITDADIHSAQIKFKTR